MGRGLTLVARAPPPTWGSRRSTPKGAFLSTRSSFSALIFASGRRIAGMSTSASEDAAGGRDAPATGEFWACTLYHQSHPVHPRWSPRQRARGRLRRSSLDGVERDVGQLAERSLEWVATCSPARRMGCLMPKSSVTGVVMVAIADETETMWGK